MSSITCPVSKDHVDENVVRLIALLTICITLVAIVFQSYVIMFLLAFDFSERAFFKGKGSLLKWTAQLVHLKLNLPSKKVGASPKKFAALVGMIFTSLIAVTILADVPLATYVLSTFLIICSFLEAAFGFCTGCMLYTYMVLPFTKK